MQWLRTFRFIFFIFLFVLRVVVLVRLPVLFVLDVLQLIRVIVPPGNAHFDLIAYFAPAPVWFILIIFFWIFPRFSLPNFQLFLPLIILFVYYLILNFLHFHALQPYSHVILSSLHVLTITEYAFALGLLHRFRLFQVLLCIIIWSVFFLTLFFSSHQWRHNLLLLHWNACCSMLQLLQILLIGFIPLLLFLLFQVVFSLLLQVVLWTQIRIRILIRLLLARVMSRVKLKLLLLLLSFLLMALSFGINLIYYNLSLFSFSLSFLPVFLFSQCVLALFQAFLQAFLPFSSYFYLFLTLRITLILISLYILSRILPLQIPGWLLLRLVLPLLWVQKSAQLAQRTLHFRLRPLFHLHAALALVVVHSVVKVVVFVFEDLRGRLGGTTLERGLLLV